MTEGIGGPAGGPAGGGYQIPAAGSIELMKDLVRDAGARERLGGAAGFAEVLRRVTGEENGLPVDGGRPRDDSAAARTDRKLLDACYEMESIFVGYMLRSMRRTIDESDFFGKSMAKDIFRDMLYDEYAKTMARTDQLGIARQIYNQLSVR
jgi:flagellar protein FlgJ